jgi:hypothetical protein
LPRWWRRGVVIRDAAEKFRRFVRPSGCPARRRCARTRPSLKFSPLHHGRANGRTFLGRCANQKPQARGLLFVSTLAAHRCYSSSAWSVAYFFFLLLDWLGQASTDTFLALLARDDSGKVPSFLFTESKESIVPTNPFLRKEFPFFSLPTRSVGRKCSFDLILYFRMSHTKNIALRLAGDGGWSGVLVAGVRLLSPRVVFAFVGRVWHCGVLAGRA